MTKIYPWLQQTYDQIEQAYARQRLHHGILFSGQAGQGRLALCQSVAATLLCTSAKPPRPCGHCSGCKLVEAASHPDYIVIGEDSEEANISIEQIRSMIDQLEQKSHQGFNRVVIIHQAHRLNRAAANALLKSLEEPPEDTYMLLTSSRPGRLPATIRSRLQICPLPSPPKSETMPWLAQQANMPQNQAEFVLARAEGAPLLALQLAQGQDKMLRCALQVTVDHFRHGTGSAGSLIESLNDYPPIDVLKLLDNWLCEMIRHSLSGEAVSAANADLADWIEGLSKGLQCRTAFRVRDKIWRSVEMIEAQINPNILLLYTDCLLGLQTIWAKTAAAKT